MFVVETADSVSGRKLKATWRNNMSVKDAPVVKDHKGKDFTSVTFTPDLARFKMTELDEDIVALLSKRAYDVCASASCHGTPPSVLTHGNSIEQFYVRRLRVCCRLSVRGSGVRLRECSGEPT